MLPPITRRYLLTALESAPDVLERLLQGLGAGDPAWDFRPDPERFTLREALAHLADWEEVFLDRMVRTVEQEEPVLQDLDEERLAEEREYGRQDPLENLRRFRTGRERMLAFLQELEESSWARSGTQTVVGRMTVVVQAVQVAGHDGYHRLQVVQWLAAAGR